MRKLSLLAGLLCCISCLGPLLDPISPTDKGKSASYYTNLFAYSNMSAYYLWEDQIQDELGSWTFSDDPVAKVQSMLYKDENGNLVDRWTELMEDCTPFMNSVSGNGKTHGFEFVLYRVSEASSQVKMVVTFTYAGSPAQEAGLQRGDIVVTVDGEEMNLDNYSALLTDKIYNNPGTLRLGLARKGDSSLAVERDVTMQAVDMYCNPVHTVRTLDVEGRKMGYLHFTNFTQDACEELLQAFKQFKGQGITDLVLDLRYNTGGYVMTGAFLASMIVPGQQVSDGAVFNRSIYNQRLSKVMETEVCFADSFTLPIRGHEKTLYAMDGNPGIGHLWVIVTGQSASASESLICGLKPYMDVTLVGSQTYGKFCGGYLITAEDWFDALKDEDVDFDCDEGRRLTKNWGLYVIASRYADCNGITLSMPSGIPADYEALDVPTDGYELGDPSESMLSAVLALASGHPFAAPAVKSSIAREHIPFSKPGSGVLIY